MGSEKIKALGGKVNISLNTKPEKMIMAASLGTAAAILLTGKRNKGLVNFVKRTKKSYQTMDRVLGMTVARQVAENEKQKAREAEFKTKLRDLEIEDSIPLDLSEDL
ncbi:MAG: hypothetical protein IJ806_00100 [Ruminococcus sp.]|nr:hypothetical protein [Ruminococcus sp.]